MDPMKLECLKQAVATGVDPSGVVALAGEFFSFVSGGKPPTEGEKKAKWEASPEYKAIHKDAA